MNADARRRRQARKSDPYADALPGVLRRPTGCLARCPVCLSRCLADIDEHHDEHHDEHPSHWFPCNCDNTPGDAE